MSAGSRARPRATKPAGSSGSSFRPCSRSSSSPTRSPRRRFASARTNQARLRCALQTQADGQIVDGPLRVSHPELRQRPVEVAGRHVRAAGRRRGRSLQGPVNSPSNPGKAALDCRAVPINRRRQRDGHAVCGLRRRYPVESDVPVSQGNPDRPVLRVSCDDRVLIRPRVGGGSREKSGRDLRPGAVRHPSGAGSSGRGREAGVPSRGRPPRAAPDRPGEHQCPRHRSGSEARLREVEPLGGQPPGRRRGPGPFSRRPPGQRLRPEDEHVADILAEPRPVTGGRFATSGRVEPGRVIEHAVTLGDLAAVNQPFLGQRRVHEWRRQEPDHLPTLIPQPAVGRARLDPLIMPAPEEECRTQDQDQQGRNEPDRRRRGEPGMAAGPLARRSRTEGSGTCRSGRSSSWRRRSSWSSRAV